MSKNKSEDSMDVCIAGIIWGINPNEGDAFIKKFATIEEIKTTAVEDIRYVFEYCPVCGKKIDISFIDQDEVEVIKHLKGL